jgi:hypothetical protein
MKLKLKDMVGGQEVLGGAVEGRRHLGLLIEAVGPEPDRPEPLFIDYAGLVLATASYLRETLVAVHSLLRTRRSRYYVVIANACPAVREDIEVLARLGGLAFLSCSLTEADEISNVGLIGTLDPKQKATFDEVCARGETDARELMLASAGHEDVRQTAFNNRLASLVNLGLVAEICEGKSKRYRPVLEGVWDGR